MNIEDLKKIYAIDGSVTAYFYKTEDGFAIPKEPDKIPEVKIQQGQCFIFFENVLSINPEFNRVFYKPLESSSLKASEIQRWLNYCIKYKLLPSYASTMTAETGFCFDLKIHKTLLYIYLCSVRHIREEPGIIKAALYLFEKEKIDFLAAIVLATYSFCNNSNHNYLPIVNGNSFVSPSLRVVKVPLRIVLALRNFLNNPPVKQTGRVQSLTAIPFLTKIESDLTIPHIRLNYQEFKDKYIKYALKHHDMGEVDKFIKKFEAKTVKLKKEMEKITL